jgi:hypothetical protein
MMGSKNRVFAPVVNVSLGQLVPADHFYRHLHRSRDLSFVRELVAPSYAAGTAIGGSQAVAWVARLGPV